MEKQEVFDVIQGEREYQRLKWGTVSPSGSIRERQRSVADFLTLMEHQLNEAKRAWCGTPSDAAALERLRKLLALGVACAEQHGLPYRPELVVVRNAISGRMLKA